MGWGSDLGAQFGFGGGGAAGDASKAMIQANKKVGKEYDSMYSDISPMYQPYTGAGQQAMGMLQSGTADYNAPLMRKFSDTDFYGDPAYQWRLQQGINALQSSAASKGNLFSGAAGKALNQYGQNFASNEYQNAYNRYVNDQQNQFKNLYSLGSLGLQGAGGLASAREAQATGKANALLGIGQGQASGYMGQAAQKAQGFNNLMNLGSMIGMSFI